MSKVLSTLDYWEEFFKKYPDKEPFIDFVSQDESLLKIFKFTSWPDISLIKQYPFEDKIKEKQSISQKDIDCLNDLYIEAGEDPKREKETLWLEYLASSYELAGTTLRSYRMLKEDTTASQNEIVDSINRHFRYHLAIDKTYIIGEDDGVQTAKRIIGRIHPTRRFIFINNNMLQIHFLLEPMKNEIKEIKNKLDIKSVINFQRYRPIGPIFDRICFGGDYRSSKHLVEFYFKDKMLDKFSYPIRKRFEKLIRKTLKSIPEDEGGGDIGVDPESLAEEMLSEKALSYKPSTGVRPAGYFENYFKIYFKKEYYEKLGTTNLPGDPRPQEGAYPYCDEYCKNQKELESRLPCKYETAEGYCKDPDKKKPEFIWSIEHSGPGLDGIVVDEDGSITLSSEQVAKKIHIYPEIRGILEKAGLEKEELELYRLYFESDLTQEELELSRLYFESDLTQEEIAKKLEITETELKERINRIRKKRENNLTQEEIAKKLKISQSVVSERVNWLEKRIQETIEKYLPPEEYPPIKF
jgi:predicted DNA-binding protein (UPF0251 family)